jgi:tripartite-type tricarboxylate transporter receptor subunit TctC
MRSHSVQIAALVLAFAVAFCPSSSFAQEFPNKPLHIIVPDGPGGVIDLRSRQIAAKLAEFLGQPVIIDNRPGGDGFVGAQAAARAPADGHTLLVGYSGTHITNPLLFTSLPYRPDEDFVPVTLITSGPYILAVSAQTPATSLAHFLALAKEKPGDLNCGVFAVSGHIVMQMINSAAGVQLVHVPYKSSGALITDVVGGQLHAGLNFWSVIGPHVQTGKVRALAVAGPRRLAVAPDVPTFAEVGFPEVEATGWTGVFVPAGTPKPIIARLHAELVRAVNSDEIRNQIIQSGAEPGGNTPEEFAAYIRTHRARWKRAVEDGKIAAQ